MLLTTEMPDAKHYEIFDGLDRKVRAVVSFNTETCEAELYPYNSAYAGELIAVCTDDGEPIKLKAILKGAYAVDKRTGERVI